MATLSTHGTPTRCSHRINIMIDAGLLVNTDGAAKAASKTRSGYIEDALKRG